MEDYCAPSHTSPLRRIISIIIGRQARGAWRWSTWCAYASLPIPVLLMQEPKGAKPIWGLRFRPTGKLLLKHFGEVGYSWSTPYCTSAKCVHITTFKYISQRFIKHQRHHLQVIYMSETSIRSKESQRMWPICYRVKIDYISQLCKWGPGWAGKLVLV